MAKETKQYSAKWRKENLEKARESSRNWARNHKEQLQKNLKNWRKENPSKEKTWVEKYKKINPERIKNWQLKKYGISLNEYNVMRIKQNHKCGICGVDEAENGKDFCVDHCHLTGKVRGLLCYRCNFILGHAKDSIDILSRAITYLND